MKITILHLTDPHWICFNARNFILSRVYQDAHGDETTKTEVVARVRQLIEKDVADYGHIKHAFNNVDITHHFQSIDGATNTSVLLTTGDLANFFSYHGVLTVAKQFADIRSHFLPLIEGKHRFDLKIAVPGNHDVDKDSQSPSEAVRFRRFYGIFDTTWHTPLSDPSLCIGEKPNQIRIWLLNSSRRVGIDKQSSEQKALDTVHIFEQDIDKWREALQPEDRMRIVVMHHSPVPNDSDLRKRDVFVNNHHFNGTLVQTNVKLVLSGHHHIGDELYAAIPGCLQPFPGRIEPVAANPMIESGFLSVSAPTFLRSPDRSGYSQGFNIVEVEILPGDNIATVTVTKYRFTSEHNDPRFQVMECPLRYRIALARLQDIFPEPTIRERRIAVMENAAREIYSTRPIEPLERVLGIKLSAKTLEDLHRIIDSLKGRKERILGLYSVTVLPPAAWWANQLTRRFRGAFLENINRAIHRGASLRQRRPTAFFQLSESLHAAVTQALSSAESLGVVQRLRSEMSAEEDKFAHEERDFITESLEAAGGNLAVSSLSAWGRNVSMTPNDDKISERWGDSNVLHTLFEKGPWDIPRSGDLNDIRRPEDSFELARILYWPLEDFDSGYALRVIEFHEDFHVPLFWLSPEWLRGRLGEPRKAIGTFLICEKGPTTVKSITYPSNIRGEAPTEHDVYPADKPNDAKAIQFWGAGAYPKVLHDSPNSGTLEMRALLRRPDILFASDVWALRKMHRGDSSDVIADYLAKKSEECKAWLAG
jgi:3',5'-cyclic AMP phosphodiesterase CpdA